VCSRIRRLPNALFAASILAAVLICAGAARATPLLPTFGDAVHVTSKSAYNLDTARIAFAGLPGGSPLTVYAAPELLSGTFGAANTAFSNLLGYCTDLYDYSAAPATFVVGHLISSHQPSGLNDLVAAQINNIATLISASHADKTAVQLAIWSVEYGSAFSFSGTSGTIATDVASYLAALNGTAPGAPLYQLQAAGVQGFAYTTQVPEPVSVTLLAVAVAGVAAVRRRRACA
jgi:hypothetical protein